MTALALSSCRSNSPISAASSRDDCSSFAVNSKSCNIMSDSKKSTYELCIIADIVISSPDGEMSVLLQVT